MRSGTDASPIPAGPGPRRSHAWLALFILAAGHAALRLAMNREFEGAPWDELLAFTAAKPFGLRVLVPLLAWPLHTLLRVPTTWVFGLFETLATMALVLATAAALRPHVPPRWATALGVSLVLLLPVPFLLQHRWPIYYPYDTPAMAFTAAGVALLQRNRWRLAAALAFAAALNRESAILLPFAALALHLRRDTPVPSDIPPAPSNLASAQPPSSLASAPPPSTLASAPAPSSLASAPPPSTLASAPAASSPASPPDPSNLASAAPPPSTLASTPVLSASSSPAPLRPLLLRVVGLFAAVALARGLVALALRDNPGAPLQFLVDGSPRLLQNLAWLEEPTHWLRLPAYLGFLPLAWALLHPWMPASLRRLGWVALAYFGALMWVANIDEPRVYGEVLVLLHLPVAVALVRWLRGDPTPV